MRPTLAELLDLAPHPEGGWFRRTWTAPIEIELASYDGSRPTATSIYYLLSTGERSAWHQVRSDELWLHHQGVPLVLRIGGSGSEPGDAVREVVLGPDLAVGQVPQALVPAGHWQAAAPLCDGDVLVSCVVSPGFDFADWRELPPARPIPESTVEDPQ
ncbi:MAG TPA: cupin domain-containing protein [Propionibacteriaceae bacterium]